MTTVSAGATGTYTFAQGDSCTVTIDSGEQAIFRVHSSAGALVASDNVSHTQTFGPFNAGDLLTLAALRGDVDYAISSVGGFGLPATLSSAQTAAAGVGVAAMTSAGDTLSLSGQVIGTRLLKSFTGASVLTGGSTGTKTTLLQVNLPDGCLVSNAAELLISTIFGFTLNTNSKSWGIDIGTTAGGATSIVAKTRSSATSGADSQLLSIQRSPLTSTKIILGYGAANGMTQEGAVNVNTSTYTQEIAIDPTTTGLKLFFWGRLDTANTDQVTLARARVVLGNAEQ